MQWQVVGVRDGDYETFRSKAKQNILQRVKCLLLKKHYV
jgi:hypothetical protein